MTNPTECGGGGGGEEKQLPLCTGDLIVWILHKSVECSNNKIQYHFQEILFILWHLK